MSLILDKTMSKKLEDRLNEFSKFGMTFYYLLENGRASMSDLENIFFANDDEKSCFIYGNLIKKVTSNDIKLSFDKYSKNNPNENKKDKTKYEEDLNLLYTKKILNMIANDSKHNVDKIYVNTYNYLLSNNIND